MKNKILFIDPVCLNGHLNFNQIHLSALSTQGYSIDTCLTKEYYYRLKCKDVNLIYEIPEKNIITNKGGLRYRISMIKSLTGIKRHVDLSQYDCIVISCYDEIALALSFFPSSFIINHNNICKLNNSIKKFFFNLVTKKHRHIVLCESAKKYIEERYANSKVYRVQHGLPGKIKVKREKNDRYTIFAPSQSSTDKTSTQHLLLTPDFNNWLEQNNAQFIVRGEFEITDSDNIKVISGFLPENEYSKLFINADCIFINYPISFRYRVSAVLFECIANNKSLVINDLPEFSEYKGLIEPNSFFSNIDTLISTLNRIKGHQSSMTINDQYLLKLKPDYSFLK